MNHAKTTNRLAHDLDSILARSEPLWQEMPGQRILITGATGFFGCWLLESFAWANRRLALRPHAVGLPRNPGRLAERPPHLPQDPAIPFPPPDFPPANFSPLAFSL